MTKKKFQKPKSSNDELVEKCTRCKTWVTFDEYWLNKRKCQECNAATNPDQDNKCQS